ncbi:hypothetical protein C8R42DRAFT_728506 [Lentinula raphanica]|nr:hypothetical protein C8R42DRAFT_728506 [Lentinula raphanica]
MTTSPGGSFLEERLQAREAELEAHLAEVSKVPSKSLSPRLPTTVNLHPGKGKNLLKTTKPNLTPANATSTLNAAQTYDPFAEPLYNGERSSEQLFDDDNEELPFPFPIVEPSSDVNVERGEDVPEDVSTDYHGGSGDDLGDVDLLHPLVNEDDLDLVYPYPEVLPDGTCVKVGGACLNQRKLRSRRGI